jgi:hypothetical protein
MKTTHQTYHARTGLLMPDCAEHYKDHAPLRVENERLTKAAEETHSFGLKMIEENEALKAHIAELEAERAEWCKLYRPLFGHDWDKRSKSNEGM